MSDQNNCPECVEGAPAWVMTFADLMSLLMCFFVLLLSFAVMDAQKFKQLAGSMKAAFGVQSQMIADQIPKGTSIIAQEFSPGKPDETEIDDIRQRTMEDIDPMLDVTDAMQEEIEQAQATAEAISEVMALEIEQGKLNVEMEGAKVVVRIQEKGSFRSGSATLDPQFSRVMMKIANTLSNTAGDIVVAGHSDDIPISTDHYRSNWELSASRAVSVVHALVATGVLAMDRFLVEGHAETDPLVKNDSPGNRAKNRRVEIVLLPRSMSPGSGKKVVPKREEKAMVVEREKSHKKSRFDAIAAGLRGE